MSQNYIKIVQSTKQIHIESVHPIKQKRKFFGFVLIVIEVLFIKIVFGYEYENIKIELKKNVCRNLTGH